MSADRVEYETGVTLIGASETETIKVPGNGALPGGQSGQTLNYGMGPGGLGTPYAPDILIRGFMQVTPGPGTTALRLKWRRFQDFAFLNFYAVDFPVTANVAQTIPICFYLFGNANFPTLQALGLGWNADIALTVQQIGATGNGNINYILLESEQGYSPSCGH